jgi:serine/threonine protein kinase
VCEYSFSKEFYNKVDPTIFDLLTQMLEKDPARRISADAALNHSYFT